MSEPLSVLLIDDDPTNNFLTERLFERLGVADQVLITESGQDALDLLAAPDAPVPSLVLLDLNMPGLSGAEFLAEYRQRREGSPPVVVVLTTSTNPTDISLVKQLRIDGLVNKPLTEDKLQHLLRLHFPALYPDDND